MVVDDFAGDDRKNRIAAMARAAMRGVSGDRLSEPPRRAALTVFSRADAKFARTDRSGRREVSIETSRESANAAKPTAAMRLASAPPSLRCA